MENYEQILNYGIIAVIVMLAIHVLFRNIQNEDPVQEAVEEFNLNLSSPMIETYDEDIFRPSNYRSKPQPVPTNPLDHYSDAPIVEDCPVKKNELQIFKYTKNNIIARSDPQGPKCRKDFNDDFFSFRDKVWGNSSMTLDPVDKINALYLSDNYDEVRGYPNGFRIKDFYDSLTEGGIFSKRSCVRVPDFDGNPIGDNRVNFH